MPARKDWTHCKNGHLLDEQNTIVERNAKTKSGLQRRCKTCCLAYKRLKEQKPERRAWRKNWRPAYEAQNRLRTRDTDLKRRDKDRSGYNLKHRLQRYGITVEQYQAMGDAQNWKCAICRQEKRLDVDHCHRTGKIRGLLCNGCNTAIARFEENVRVMQQAATYIIRHLDTPDDGQLHQVPAYHGSASVQ